jgi:mxaL protein
VEVCSHYEELLASLDMIDGRMRWADASNVGKGIAWTVRSARRMGSGVNVVFITDGHESPPLRAVDTQPMAGITPGEVGGWVIGVGGSLPARIPKTDRDGNPAGFWEADDVVQREDGPSHEHLSALNEAHLQKLAQEMGFGYRRLARADALATALLDTRMARSAPVQTDVRSVPAGLALLLLAWRFRPMRSKPTKENAPAI